MPALLRPFLVFALAACLWAVPQSPDVTQAPVAPVPDEDLTPGASRYKATIEAGGQTVALEMTSVIKPITGRWAANTSMRTPMGSATDMMILERGKLTPAERHISQGAVVIDLNYSPKKVTGTITTSGKSQPVNIPLDSPVFADAGAGSMQTIAALPLAEGYSTSFRNLDLQKLKSEMMDLKVTGSERVTVPAGTFDCYRVQVDSANGGAEKLTLWIAKSSRKTVKYQAVLADMGGAQMTAELE